MALILKPASRTADPRCRRHPVRLWRRRLSERATSAAVKIVPVAGDVVAYPLDKTATLSTDDARQNAPATA